MTRAYRLLWNDARQQPIPAPETARSRGKPKAIQTISIAVLAALSGAAQALPTSPSVNAGTATVATSGTAMTVTQSTPNASLNWQSFSIASGESVRFAQPNASSIALNRVTGTDASQIFGSLQANGQVFLINPNGVLFGSTAQVDVGGLVASTLNISDADFLAGKRTFSGTGGSVINQGTINAPNGYVALLGAQAANQGQATIRAQLGTVALAAGNAVTLDFVGDKLITVSVDQAALHAAAQNSGLVAADGGSVILTGKATDGLLSTVINQTGILQAQTLQSQNGKIVLAGADGGVAVNGSVDATTGGSIDIGGGNVAISGNVSSATQNIHASGDIAVTAHSTNVSVQANNEQTVAAGGTVTVQGGTGASLNGSQAGIVSGGTQTISASNISLLGGSGSFGSALLSGQTQSINILGGGTLSQQGGTRDSSGANIVGGPTQHVDFASGGHWTLTGGSGDHAGAQIQGNGTQSITGSPDITLVAGTGSLASSVRIGATGNQNIAAGDIALTGGTNGSSNNASIVSFSGTQTIHADNVTLTGGAGNQGNDASIGASTQQIALSGDLALRGSARIGGALSSPTDLHLAARNVTLTGGAAAGDYAVIGGASGQQANIVLNPTGDLTLNPGVTGAGSYIGSSGNAAMGGISITAAGNVAFNSSAVGRNSIVQSLGDVAITTTTAGKTVTEGADSFIRARGLTLTTNGAIALTGGNQVSSLNVTTGVGANVLFANHSPELSATFQLSGPTTPASQGGGLFNLSQIGNLSLVGESFSGPQNIRATGNITIGPVNGGTGLRVNAVGTQRLMAGGDLVVQGGTSDGAHSILSTTGNQTLIADGNVLVQGGSGADAYALVSSGGNIDITAGGTVRLQEGSGKGQSAYARVQTESRDSTIGLHFPNLSSGGWFVNGVEGAIRRGQSGFFSGNGAAVLGRTLLVTYGH